MFHWLLSQPNFTWSEIKNIVQLPRDKKHSLIAQITLYPFIQNCCTCASKIRPKHLLSKVLLIMALIVYTVSIIANAYSSEKLWLLMVKNPCILFAPCFSNTFLLSLVINKLVDLVKDTKNLLEENWERSRHQNFLLCMVI